MTTQTTADMYAAPHTERQTTEAPDLVPELGRAVNVALAAHVSLKRTIEDDAALDMPRRAELRRQLAALSVDPNSMDRESEVDIWGFHNGA